jgi:hypothetical protein
MKRFKLVAGIVTLALMVSGCAFRGTPRHRAVQGAETFAYAVFGVQDAELALFRAGKVSIDQHRAFQGPLIKTLKAGEALNTAILLWPQDDPVPPAEVRAAVGAVRELLDTTLSVFGATIPPEIQTALNQVQLVLFTLLDLGIFPGVK